MSDPTSLERGKNPLSLESGNDPLGNDPTSLESGNDPTSLESGNDPTSLESGNDPTSLDSGNDPTSLESEKDPTSLESRKRRSNRCPCPGDSRNYIKKKVRTGPFLDEEKELVLSALYTYGSNVDKIAPLIPSRSREQVRDFLTSWYRRVRKVPVVLSDRDRQTAEIKEPIEFWLDQIRKGTESFIASNEGTLPTPWFPYALGYIAKFENHPHISATGGVDFRKLYEFLEAMMNGNVSQPLGFADAVFILTSLRKLKLRLEKIEFHKDEAHLKRSGPALQPRTYKRVKKEITDTELSNKNDLEALLSSKIMNPLDMPMTSLSVKERLKSQASI